MSSRNWRISFAAPSLFSRGALAGKSSFYHSPTAMQLTACLVHERSWHPCVPERSFRSLFVVSSPLLASKSEDPLPRELTLRVSSRPSEVSVHAVDTHRCEPAKSEAFARSDVEYARSSARSHGAHGCISDSRNPGSIFEGVKARALTRLRVTSARGALRDDGVSHFRGKLRIRA